MTDEEFADLAERTQQIVDFADSYGWTLFADRATAEMALHNRRILGGTLTQDEYHKACGWIQGAQAMLGIPQQAQAEYERVLRERAEDAEPVPGVTATLVFPHDIPSSLTESEGLKLAELATGGVVIELGCWYGRSTVLLAQTAETLHSVDWHQGDAHAGEEPTLTPYLQNLNRYGLVHQIVIHIGRFEQILPVLRDDSFDMVFLDGLHTYEQVRSDLEHATPLVRPGGIVACHDYGVEASSRGGGAFGVTQAFDEMFGEPDELVGTLAIKHL